MKKSLIALAVLAASGAAMAQSSVTLFGRVDAYVGVETTGVGAAELTKNRVSNGGLTGSRWGMMGTEDLGGGLKAMFNLENRFSVDDGTSAGQFLGNAFVGLGGGFGTVKLGRTYTAFDDARAVSNSSNVFDSSFTPNVFGTGADYTVRGANGVRYETPAFGGFSGALSYSFGEDKTAATDATHITSLLLKYAAGPLTAAYGYQDDTLTQNKFHQLSGAYNFGMASVSAGYERRNGTALTGDDRGYNIGVNVPVGAAVNLSAGYAREDVEVAGATTAKGTGFGLGATYTLSKRTKLYAGYKSTKVVDGAGAETAKTRLTGVGIRHDF